MNNLRESLTHFRSTHAYVSQMIHGIQWEYIRSGVGPETMLLLPGALGFGETSFQTILHFETTYRILSLLSTRPRYDSGFG
ncbi:hypothetical protein KFU94_46190 [Chloroflexi bacterium TSY]|nr:hypothetical protein [Chloroflexi bacterium TSY]